MILINEAIDAIHRHRGDALVVGTMTPNRYWEQISERPALDLPIFGAMGKASSVGLGLAIAQPDRRVVVLDGDGGLLMNLGSLVTIAGQKPRNLVYFAFMDGVYATTGGQPIPGCEELDLAVIASGAGFPETMTFDNLEDFASEIPTVLKMSGPVFVCLKIIHPEEGVNIYMGSTKNAVKRMREALGTE